MNVWEQGCPTHEGKRRDTNRFPGLQVWTKIGLINGFIAPGCTKCRHYCCYKPAHKKITHDLLWRQREDVIEYEVYECFQILEHSLQPAEGRLAGYFDTDYSDFSFACCHRIGIRRGQTVRFSRILGNAGYFILYVLIYIISHKTILKILVPIYLL